MPTLVELFSNHKKTNLVIRSGCQPEVINLVQQGTDTILQRSIVTSDDSKNKSHIYYVKPHTKVDRKIFGDQQYDFIDVTQLQGHWEAIPGRGHETVDVQKNRVAMRVFHIEEG